MSLFLSDSGQIRNYTAVMIIIFSFAVLSIIGVVIMQSFITNLDSAGYYSGQAKVTTDKFWNALLMLDKIIVVIMTLLILGVGITSYRLATAPVFFVVSIIMGFFLGAISLFFNYMFIQIVSQPVFESVLVYFPLTMVVCTNFHWIMLVVWAVGSITLYAKREKGGALDEI